MMREQRRGRARTGRGYFAVGIYRPKREHNVGGLWRSAGLYGASMVFTVGARYQRQAADTMNLPAHVPLVHYADIADLIAHLPHGCRLAGVELHDDAVPLGSYVHPARAAYLLGAEDTGLPPAVIAACHELVQIESPMGLSMNVASAGTVIAYHRHVQAGSATGVRQGSRLDRGSPSPVTVDVGQAVGHGAQVAGVR